MFEDIKQKYNTIVIDPPWDISMTGKTMNRPSFSDLLVDMRAMRFNCVMVTKLDRMGRSLQHLLGLLDKLYELRYFWVENPEVLDRLIVKLKDRIKDNSGGFKLDLFEK